MDELFSPQVLGQSPNMTRPDYVRGIKMVTFRHPNSLSRHKVAVSIDVFLRKMQHAIDQD